MCQDFLNHHESQLEANYGNDSEVVSSEIKNDSAFYIISCWISGMKINQMPPI
jgi:hypothetical protein